MFADTALKIDLYRRGVEYVIARQRQRELHDTRKQGKKGDGSAMDWRPGREYVPAR